MTAIEFHHGDSCPECHGVLVWSESEEHAGLELRCDECGAVYPSQEATTKSTP